MRDDDSDIDALLRGAALDPPVTPAMSAPSAPATKARRPKAKAPAPAARVPADPTLVEDLSRQLEAELERNAPVSLVPTAEEVAAIIAEHLAKVPASPMLIDVSPDDYHDLPGLSSTVAKTVIAQSPLHAKTMHAKFGGRGKAPTRLMDRGQIVHALVLGAGKRFATLDHPDYRTNAAKAERDAARAAGLVPILRHELVAAEAIADAIKRQLPEHGIRLDGDSEVAMQWWEETEHGFVRCRCMFDHVHAGSGVILDLKIVGDASPDAIERSAENFGYAIQAAAYPRALGRLRPELAGRVDFVFAFCEAAPPYAINVCRGDGAFRALGELRWERAVAIWARCLATNTWPAFGAGINQLGVPAWALRKEGLLQ